MSRSRQARPFVDWAEGDTCAQAFVNARSCARLFDGIGNYQGAILAKSGFFEVDVPAVICDDTGDRINNAILVAIEYAPRRDLDSGHEIIDLDLMVERLESDAEEYWFDRQWQHQAADDLMTWVICKGSQVVLEALAHYCDLGGQCLAVSLDDHKWSFLGMVDWPVRHPSTKR